MNLNNNMITSTRFRSIMFLVMFHLQTQSLLAGTDSPPPCPIEPLIRYDFGLWDPPYGLEREQSSAGDDVYNYPRTLEISKSGALYIGDPVNYQIVKFDNKGKLLWEKKLQPPVRKVPERGIMITAMALDQDDRLYVFNKNSDRIEVYSPDGKYLFMFQVTLYHHNSLSTAILQLDSDGNIYLGPVFWDRVDKWNYASIYDKTGRLIRVVKTDKQWKNIYRDTKIYNKKKYIATPQGKNILLVKTNKDRSKSVRMYECVLDFSKLEKWDSKEKWIWKNVKADPSGNAIYLFGAEGVDKITVNQDKAPK